MSKFSLRFAPKPKKNAQGKKVLKLVFISLIRMRSKRDIKMGSAVYAGGCSPRNCRWGCDVPFFKWWGYSWRKYAILGAFIRSCGCHENPTRFQTIMVKIIWAFWKKSLAFGVPPAYSRYRRFRPRGWKLVDFVLTSQGIWNVKVCHHLQ